MIGLVLGIVALVLPWFRLINVFALSWLNYLAPIVAIAGILLCIMGMKKAKLENRPQGIFIAGLVVSIIAFVETFSFFLCMMWATCAASSAVGALGSLNF